MRHAGNVLRNAWRLAGPYFVRSEERWSARLVLGVIIALILVDVQIDVVLNTWRGSFYDSLQNYDLASFISLLLWYKWDESGFMPGFVPLVMCAVPLVVCGPISSSICRSAGGAG